MEYVKIYKKDDPKNLEDFAVTFLKLFSKELNFKISIDEYGRAIYSISNNLGKESETIKVKAVKPCGRVKFNRNKIVQKDGVKDA